MIAYRKIKTLTEPEIRYILVNIMEFDCNIIKKGMLENAIQLKISSSKEPIGDIYIVLTNSQVDINVIDVRPLKEDTTFPTPNIYPFKLTPRKEELLFNFLFSLGMHERFNDNPYLSVMKQKDLMYRFSKTRNNVYEFVIGLDIDSAQTFLAELGFKTRVVRENDEFKEVKRMFNAQYLDLHVVDGIVIMVERDLQDWDIVKTIYR